MNPPEKIDNIEYAYGMLEFSVSDSTLNIFSFELQSDNVSAQ